MVRAKVGKGKYEGIHIGRVTVRATGRFVVKNGQKLVCETEWGNLRSLQRNDGYAYKCVNKFEERKGEAASAVS